MKTTETKILGSFWNQMMDVLLCESNNSKRIIINIHCLYGTMRWSADKQFRMAQFFAENNIANTILYASSRKEVESLLPKKIARVRAFVWKTFLQELQDAIIIVENFAKNYDEIVIVGHSLGGVLAFYLAEKFANISTIVTVWTWLRSEKADMPILDTFPEEVEIIEKLQKFQGRYLMCSDSEDVIFSFEKFTKFFENVSAKEKVHLHYIWVDHNFNKLYEERSNKPFDNVIKKIAHFINEQSIKSESIEL